MSWEVSLWSAIAGVTMRDAFDGWTGNRTGTRT